jgi:L-amino acid N-acyltransferase YncA
MATAVIKIAELLPEHWTQVVRIYADGILTGYATFETAPPTWDRWDSAHLPEHRFVALRDGEVVGWAAVAPVYVAEDARGQGVGQLLLEQLITSTEAAGIWTIQTGIFPENETSIRLHERVGFEIVGRRKRLGKLNGVWRDVFLLERRSDLVE